MSLECKADTPRYVLLQKSEIHAVSERIMMNYYLLVLTSLIGMVLCGVQEVSRFETRVSEGGSAIAFYLHSALSRHILPNDIEVFIVQQFILACPALFTQIARDLSGHAYTICSVVLTPDSAGALTGFKDYDELLLTGTHQSNRHGSLWGTRSFTL